MKSLGSRIRQLSGLLNTAADLTPWQQAFVGDIVDKTQDGEITGTLSPRQAETIEKIYSKHFGDA